jgi:hypothetical protein
VGFQLFGAAEASYVTDLQFLTCLDSGIARRSGT